MRVCKLAKMYRVLLLLLAYCHLHNAQDSVVTETLQKQQSLCVVPPHPANGKYTVVNKPDARPGDGLPALYLTYSCEQGNRRVGDKDVHCLHNVWTAEVPKCEVEASTLITNTSSGWSHSEAAVIPQEDNLCMKDNQQGVCRPITKCISAKRDLEMKKKLQICSFKGLEPVVCCLDDTPSAATPMPPKPTTLAAEDTPPSYDYEYTYSVAPDGCEPLPASLTSQETGRKAWDKCIEYQTKYVYPCEARVALGDALGRNKIRANHCGHDHDALYAGETNAKLAQFPHMVLLGYGIDTDTAQWLCGGSIISEKFVLTAAQCAHARQLGEVKYVRTATVKRSDPLDPKRLFTIARIIKHPEYRPPEKYNDIAILEMHTEMFLNRFARPACLPVGDSYNDSRAIAIGFGTPGFLDEPSNSLQKVILNKFSTEECSKYYPASRGIRKGFQENLQSCYGDKSVPKDTCQGDSGGPLHIGSRDIHCMYTIVGIISFGRVCGQVGVPGVYTRVAAYVPWIESVVWPN